MWTLEDDEKSGGKAICIVIEKAIKHDTWDSVVQGVDQVDPITLEEMKKKMMLEKFHTEVRVR